MEEYGFIVGMTVSAVMPNGRTEVCSVSVRGESDIDAVVTAANAMLVCIGHPDHAVVVGAK